MNVPNLPFLEKKSKSEYFLSLVLRDEKASAVVFEQVNGKLNVIGEHLEPFKTSVEEASEEELLSVLDKAVSLAEKNLPEGVESQKTIFGIKESWVENEKIKKDYLAKLKKISDELDFKPMGFLVISEAISHLLQKEEGAPTTAILAEINQKNITISLIRGGKIVETKSAPPQESIPETVDKLLHHFTGSEILPARIILFDGGNENLQQEFIGHTWSKSLPFLHLPQVTSLPLNFDARAVLNGAAMQMGFEVLETSLTKATKEDRKESVEHLEPEQEGQEQEDKTLGEVASEFGFSEEDIKEKNKPKIAVEEEVQNDNEVQSDNIDIQRREREIPFGRTLRGFLGILKRINIMKALRTANSSRKKLLFLAIPLVVLILILYIYFFVRTATITLNVESKEAAKEETVTFSKSGATDASGNIISAKFITVSQDGKVSKPTTGKKETGDKAKGTVTIFNNNDTARTIPVGTVLISSTDLKFLTDKAVTVASASGDIFSGTKPGTSDVPVTAEKFGTNYNLPSNTKFSFEGTSSIAAKNDNAFSGGTKKDIKVVSKEDTKNLEKDLQKQVEGKARDEAKKKAGQDFTVLPNFVSVSFGKKSFSKDVDDEASEVSLTGVIDFEVVSYTKSEIIAYAKEKLKKNIEEGLTIDEEKISVSASDIKQEGGKITAKVNVKAGLTPDINEREIAKRIAGKSISEANSFLSEIPEVRSTDIDIFLNLPILPKKLPFSPGKIKVVVNKNG